MEKKRIFLINCTDFPEGMAVSSHSKLIIKGLRENNSKATLIIPYGDMGSERNTRIRGHIDGVPFFYLNKTTKRSRNLFISFFQIIFGMINTSFVIMKYKKKLNSIIIYSPDYIKYYLVFIIIRLFKIPLFIWEVEKPSSIINSNFLRRMISKWSAYRSENYLPKIASGYIVISSYLKEFYSKYTDPDKILLSPILVNNNFNININKNILQDNFLYKKYKNKKVIVYSGSFAEKDGVEYLIKAFFLVHQQIPESTFVLTGSSFHNDTLNKIKKLAEDLKFGDSIEFVGLVNRETLNIFNKIACMFLVCRTNSEFSKFGFPWKLGEYCLTGKPILATNVGDISKYFTDMEHLFIAEPEDSLSIANKMMTILEDYSFALNIAENAKHHVLNLFNYKNEMRKVKNFIILNSA